VRLDRCTFMQSEKKETLLQNQLIRQRLLQIVVLKSLPQRGCCFLYRKLIQHFVRQAKLNRCQGFLIQLLPNFFISWGLFSLSSSAFFNPLWVRMTFILIFHLLKLMTPSNFWISKLIADIFTLSLLWYQLLWNNLYALIPIVVISREDSPMTGSTGAVQRIWSTGSTKATWRREEEEDITK